MFQFGKNKMTSFLSKHFHAKFLASDRDFKWMISSKQQTETRVRNGFLWKSSKKVPYNLAYSGWVMLPIIRGCCSPKECEIMETLPPFASKWGFLVVNISYNLKERLYFFDKLTSMENLKIILWWYLLSSCCKAAQISMRNRGLESARLRKP